MKNALLTLFFLAGLATTQLSAQSCCNLPPQCCVPACCVKSENAGCDQKADVKTAAATCTPEQAAKCTPEELKNCQVSVAGARKTASGATAIANLRSKGQGRTSTAKAQKL
ncbi:MAG: hypothetical protein JNJ57_09810 [Saprospiraceae bacterium]|nr:hypothetical protein [Saprospiraceae bacterium]